MNLPSGYRKLKKGEYPPNVLEKGDRVIGVSDNGNIFLIEHTIQGEKPLTFEDLTSFAREKAEEERQEKIRRDLNII